TLFNETAQKHPDGRQVAVKIKALGVLPGDRANLRVYSDGVPVWKELRPAGVQLTFGFDLAMRRVELLGQQMKATSKKIEDAWELSRKAEKIEKRRSELEKELAELSRDSITLPITKEERAALAANLRRDIDLAEKSLEAFRKANPDLSARLPQLA